MHNNHTPRHSVQLPSAYNFGCRLVLITSTARSQQASNPRAPQDSDAAAGRRSRPRRRPRQYLFSHRKKHRDLQQRPLSPAAAGPGVAVGAKVLVLWTEKWAQATGGWIAGTVVALSDGTLPNPNGPGRVTRGWAVVQYDAEGRDCHVHLLDPKHHHDARGDREMAWRLQQDDQQQQHSPEQVWEDWDVSSAASPRLPYSESSASTSCDESDSEDGGERGGADGAGMERCAALCDFSAEDCSRGSLEKGSCHANTAVETSRAAGELDVTLPDMVSEFLAQSSVRRHHWRGLLDCALSGA